MPEIKIEAGHGGDGYECPGCGNDKIEPGQSFCLECDEQTEWKEEQNLANKSLGVKKSKFNKPYALTRKNRKVLRFIYFHYSCIVNSQKFINSCHFGYV